MMSKISFLIGLLIANITARAADMWPDPNLCAHDVDGFSLPADVKKDDFMKLMHPQTLSKKADEAEVVCTVGLKDWKATKQTIGLLMTKNFKKNSHGGADEGAAHIYLAVFDSPKTMKVIATLPQALELPAQTEDRPNESLKSLDLAPYKMAEDHYAFGLRTEQLDSHSGGGDVYKFIRLFHIKEKNLVQILGPLMMQNSSDMAGDWHEDGTRDHEQSDSGAAILRMGKAKTEGMFDIERVKKVKKKANVDSYQWDGNAYSTDDETFSSSK